MTLEEKIDHLDELINSFNDDNERDLISSFSREDNLWSIIIYDKEGRVVLEDYENLVDIVDDITEIFINYSSCASLEAQQDAEDLTRQDERDYWEVQGVKIK